MYEENLVALPDGDFSRVFAGPLAEIDRLCRPALPATITPDRVLNWAKTEVQPHFAGICRRLLLPSSGIQGIDNLAEANRLAGEGRSCIICLNHRSNLDVPTLYALLDDEDRAGLFERIVWIAGRKLQEDVGATRMLAQGFNRVMVTPHSWMRVGHSDEELRMAHQINLAAHRAIHELRHRGWVFALFPTATRLRPNDASTAQAIEETDSYLKSFEFLLLGRVEGCTLPVSRNQDLTHETPVLDRMRYIFGPVQRTDAWRARHRATLCPQRSANGFGRGHHRGYCRGLSNGDRAPRLLNLCHRE